MCATRKDVADLIMLCLRIRRHGERLWAALGADLWLLKLREPLSKLGSSAATYARGQVRPECCEGVQRLLAVVQGMGAGAGAGAGVTRDSHHHHTHCADVARTRGLGGAAAAPPLLARVAMGGAGLLPSAVQLQAIDKRFGGALMLLLLLLLLLQWQLWLVHIITCEAHALNKLPLHLISTPCTTCKY